MTGEPIGKVVALALRPAEDAPMHVVESADAAVDGSLTGDHATKPERGITLISARQWRQVQKELGGDIPWHTRRANVLVDCDGMGTLIGRTIRVGEVVVDVKNETKPCEVMDRQQPGLREALKPDCRGGIYGQIVRGGRIRVGDPVTLQAP